MLLQDLQGRTLRTPIDPMQTFLEVPPRPCIAMRQLLLQDPLRVLRALRFASQLQPRLRPVPSLCAASG